MPKDGKILTGFVHSTMTVADAMLLLLWSKVMIEWKSFLVMNRWRKHFWKLVWKNIARMPLYMRSVVYQCRHLRGANFKFTQTIYVETVSWSLRQSKITIYASLV